MRRIVFPLNGGVNTSGVISALSLVVGVMISSAGRGFALKSIGYAVIAFSLFGVLACDSRGALVFTIATLLFFSLAPLSLLKKLPWAAAIAPLGAVVLLGLILILPPEWRLGFLTRGVSSDTAFAVTTGRTEIWVAAIKRLADIQPIHFVGFGLYGQIVSGIAQDYSALFDRGGGALFTFHSLHNFALQHIIDMGYIGLATLIALCVAVLRRLCDNLSGRSWTPARGLAAILVVMLLCGSTEIVPSFYARDSYLFFLLLALATAFCFGTRVVSDPEPPPSPRGRYVSPRRNMAKLK